MIALIHFFLMKHKTAVILLLYAEKDFNLHVHASQARLKP